ncbi:MAG TPA: mercury(II) reductase [Geobacteraceae bacterium]
MTSNPDLIILGSGSTAFAAALRAQHHGAKVLMVEKSVLGGTCINWGCIPSKTLIHAALFNHEAGLGARLGLAIERHGVDFARLHAHQERVVQLLREERYLEVLKQMPGVAVIKGTARFMDNRTIEVNDRRYRSDRLLIAVGGYPRIPAIPGLDGVDYLTSRSALLIKTLPTSLVVIGGGVIAVELGQMFHRLGCRVTILEHGPRLLPSVEPVVAEALQTALAAEGVKVVTGVDCCSVAKVGDLSVVNAQVAGRPHEYTAEKLLLAVGTTPATAGIGLERAGVALDRHGFIIVDRQLRSSTPGIWAAGDVTGGMMIATAGAREGVVAVDDMYDPTCGCTMDYLTTPMAIFSDPEVGLVGHTEAAALAAGYRVAVNTLPVSAIPKAHVTGHTAGVIKLVADRDTGRLLGAHLACHRAAELINEAALALRLKATVTELANTLHVYPSMGEGLRLCAQGFDRDVSKLSCCAE